MLTVISTLFSAFLIFSVSWWVFLFMILPIGIDHAPNAQAGHDSGAPSKARIKRKLKQATIVAFIFTLILTLLIESGLVSLEALLGVSGWEFDT